MTTQTKIKMARQIQDDIFRKMPVAKKIRLASNFFALAKKLNKSLKSYGAGRIVIPRRGNIKQT